MTARFGRCTNYGNCTLADTQEKILIPPGAIGVVCPQPGCGKPIVPLDAAAPNAEQRKWALLGGIVLLALILAIFLPRFLNTGGDKGLPPLPTAQPTQIVASPAAEITSSPTPQATEAATLPPAGPSPEPSALPAKQSPAPALLPTPTKRPPTPAATLPVKRHISPSEATAEPTYGAPPTVEPTLAPTVAPTAVPVAQPSASAVACLIPNAPARILDRAREVYPKSWLGSGQSPEVDVKVDLDERGDVSHATIVQSGNSKAFDDAAMEAALRSTYAAPIENCIPRAGTILFRVKFYLSD